MIKTTTIEVSIHEEKENPIHGEGVIRLRLEDDGAGGFFSLSQPTDNPEQKVEMTLEELSLAYRKAIFMLKEYSAS